jgi:hypothetical protein
MGDAAASAGGGAASAAPVVELADASTPPGEVRELSAVGHSLLSVRQVGRLGAFSGLRSLVLHGGPLRSLDGLAACAASLEELNLSGNALEVIAGLGTLPQLRVLNLVRVQPAFATAHASLAACGCACCAARRAAGSRLCAAAQLALPSRPGRVREAAAALPAAAL